MNSDCKAKKWRRTKLDEWNERARKHGLSYGQYAAFQRMIREGQRVRMPKERPFQAPVRIAWRDSNIFEEAET